MGAGASAVLEFDADLFRLFDRARPEGAVTVLSARGIPEQVFADLGRVSSLGENWDTHGAPRVSTVARRRATDLVVSLYRAASTYDIRMPDPQVFVSSDGMIGLFWSNPEKGADLEVLVGEAELEAAGSESGEAYTAIVDADDPLDILALIHKHITGA